MLRASLSSRPAERAQQQAHSVKSSGAVVFKTCFLNAYNFDRAAICNSHTVCCLIFFSVFQDINKKITKRTRREQEKTKVIISPHCCISLFIFINCSIVTVGIHFSASCIGAMTTCCSVSIFCLFNISNVAFNILFSKSLVASPKSKDNSLWKLMLPTLSIVEILKNVP